MIDDREENKRMNPGVSMNRPRYIVEFLFVIIIAFICNWMMMNDGRVISFLGRTELNVMARDVDNTFIDDAKSFKIGVHRTDYAYVFRGFFPGQYVRRMYQYFTGQSNEVISVRQETNLVFDERLAQLDKYTKPIVPTVMADAIRECVNTLMDKATSHSKFTELSSSLSEMIKEHEDNDVQMGGILTSNYFFNGDNKANLSDGSIDETSKIMVRQIGRVYVPEGFALGYYVWLAYQSLIGQSREAANTRPDLDLFFDERIAHKYSHLVEQIEAVSGAASHSKISQTFSSFGRTIKEQSQNDGVQVGSILTGRIMMHRTGRVYVPEGITSGHYAWLVYRYFTGQDTEVFDAHSETDLVFDERVVYEYSYLVAQAEAMDDTASHFRISDKSSSLREKIKEQKNDDV